MDAHDSKSAQNSPYIVALRPGRYSWCSCGKSKNEPFCDGTHKLEGKFKSVKLEVTEEKKVAFCGCKHTQTPPFCDGSHKKELTLEQR